MGVMLDRKEVGRLIRVAVIAASTSIGAGAQAAWVTELSGAVDSTYDDNIRLSVNGDEESAIATNVGAEVRLRNVTETSNFTLIGGGSYITYAGYDGNDNLQNEDIQYALLSAQTRTERARWGVNGSVRRDVLLQTVGFIDDPLQAPSAEGGSEGPRGDRGDSVSDAGSDVDVGSTEEQERRLRTWINPYVNFQLTEQSSLELGYSFVGLDYDNDTGANLDDSTSQSVSLDYWQQISELTALRLGGRAGQFEADSDSENTDAYEVSVGLERQFSPVFQASIDLGVQRSERANDNDTGYLVRVRGLRRTELGGLLGEYEHSLQPSGYGELLESDTVLVRYSRQASPKVELRFDARGYSTRESLAVQTFADGDRDYAELVPAVTFAITEVFSVGAFYRYRWVDRQGEGSGSSNAIGLSMSIHPRSRI